jgi:hypothetical protein
MSWSGFGLVGFGDLPEQHPQGVPQAHLVQRAEVGIHDEYGGHRVHLPCCPVLT